MNILMLSYWDFQNTGMQITQKTPIYFSKNGHRVIFMVHSEMTAFPLKVSALHENLKVYRFDLPLKVLNKIPKLRRVRQLILFAIFSTISIIQEIRRNKLPDVIYAAESDAILTGFLLSRILRRPLITRYYGVSELLLNSPMRHFLYYLSLKCPADIAIITDDGTDGKRIISSMNRKIGQIKFWKNGVDEISTDTKKIDLIKASYCVKNDDFIILTVSRLYGWKRVDRAINVLHYILRKWKFKAKLMIVGKGPERENLQIQANKLGINDFVIFVDGVEHKDIFNYYHIADVFLSLYDMSNVGNPLWEAIKSHKCIVTLDNGTTKDVIFDYANGRILPHDVDENIITKLVANAIHEIYSNQDLRNRLISGVKITAKNELWSWEDRLKAELECIERIYRNTTESGNP